MNLFFASVLLAMSYGHAQHAPEDGGEWHPIYFAGREIDCATCKRYDAAQGEFEVIAEIELERITVRAPK